MMWQKSDTQNGYIWSMNDAIDRDNRCLKPNDSKTSEKWDHYDPDDFYEATSEELIIFI